MTEVDRPLRDILAECMRRERLGAIRPLWADWTGFADDECERVRMRADHLMRLLADLGVQLVRAGDPDPTMPAPQSSVIYRYGLVGRQTERLIRKAAGDRWEIVTIENGVETVEQAFTLEQASINGGMVLTDDPAARSIPGLGRQLAAVNEIYRVAAEAMEGLK